MRLALLPLALFVFLPMSAHAAGFATTPLFLSKTPVTEGETISIHAVVANDASSAFSGDVRFSDGSIKIGTVSVTIAPGGAQAVSISWSPTAGSHTIKADLVRADGTVAESQSETFSVDAKPVAAFSGSSQSAAVESSQGIQSGIAKYSPAAAQTAKPLFTTLDSARSAAASLIDDGIALAKQKGGDLPPGEILGEATKDTSATGITSTLWRILATIGYWILFVLKMVVDSAGLFYPIFALLFFWVLWRTFKAFRRPAY